MFFCCSALNINNFVYGKWDDQGRKMSQIERSMNKQNFKQNIYGPQKRTQFEVRVYLFSVIIFTFLKPTIPAKNAALLHKLRTHKLHRYVHLIIMFLEISLNIFWDNYWCHNWIICKKRHYGMACLASWHTNGAE